MIDDNPILLYNRSNSLLEHWTYAVAAISLPDSSRQPGNALRVSRSNCHQQGCVCQCWRPDWHVWQLHSWQVPHRRQSQRFRSLPQQELVQLHFESNAQPQRVPSPSWRRERARGCASQVLSHKRQLKNAVRNLQ